MIENNNKNQRIRGQQGRIHENNIIDDKQVQILRNQLLSKIE